MSNSQNSYQKVSQKQQSGQGSPIYQYNPQNEYSPFRKHLPMIPQSQTSPQIKLGFLNIDGVIQSQQILGQSFQSRCYEQGQMKSSLMSQSGQSGIVSPMQKRILLNKIYEKQKQLVLLQDKLFMLKNTNQCLRDTIKQNNAQKDRLIEQLQTMKKQDIFKKQVITQLQQQVVSLQQRLTTSKQTQQQKYFKQKNIMSKSRQELIGENESLQQSIREMISMYERQIDIILQKHEQVKGQIEKKWISLLEQKDLLLRDRQKLLVEKQVQMQQKQLLIQNQRDEMREKMVKLQEELDKVIRQKKILLQQYLQAIQGMKRQMKFVNFGQNKEKIPLKKHITSQTILPSSKQPTSENILIQHEESYQQYHHQQEQQRPTYSRKEISQQKSYKNLQNHSITKSKKSGKSKQNIHQDQQNNLQSKLKDLQKENELMKTLISNSFKENNLIGELNTSRKVERQNNMNNFSSNNYDIQLLSKANSIVSLKPINDLNTSYIAQRLNRTMVQYPQKFNTMNSYNSYQTNAFLNNRSTSNSRSNSRPKNFSRLASGYKSKPKIISPFKSIILNPYSVKTTTEYIIVNSSKTLNRQNCHLSNKYVFNQKLYKEIDNKLEQIKYQINKEITY